MPQEFHVLQCFSCQMFQVHIIKKVPKWSCKLCGEKQSVKKIFEVGTSKECRGLVQTLNKNHIEKTTNSKLSSANSLNFQSDSHSNSSIETGSKWDEFLDDSDNESSTHTNVKSDNFSPETIVKNEDYFEESESKIQIGSCSKAEGKWDEFGANSQCCSSKTPVELDLPIKVEVKEEKSVFEDEDSVDLNLDL